MRYCCSSLSLSKAYEWWGEAEAMQATEFDVEAERRGMKYHTLDSVQTMIGKGCGKALAGRATLGKAKAAR